MAENDKITTTPGYRQRWRHIGWLGGTGRLYTLDEHPSHTERGSWQPIWTLIDNDPTDENGSIA